MRFSLSLSRLHQTHTGKVQKPKCETAKLFAMRRLSRFKLLNMQVRKVRNCKTILLKCKNWSSNSYVSHETECRVVAKFRGADRLPTMTGQVIGVKGKRVGRRGVDKSPRASTVRATSSTRSFPSANPSMCPPRGRNSREHPAVHG